MAAVSATPGHETIGVSSRKLAMWIFLVSEVIFFSALIGTGIVLRLTTPLEQWPGPGVILDVPLTSLNTFVLIVSSVTVVKGLEAIQRDDQTRFRIYIIATFLLGSLFLGIQAYEYYKLYHEGLFLTEFMPHAHGAAHGAIEGASHAATQALAPIPSTYGTAFYIQTGFHGAHVFGGVVWLAIVIGYAFAGRFSSQNYEGYEIFGLYWHFVDLVWILLFTIVYLV